MEELTIRGQELPETLGACVDYMVISEEKLNAIKAAIRAAQKTAVPTEALDKLTAQAQLLGAAVIECKIKIGELTAAMPTAAGRPSNSAEPRQTKAEQLKALGLSHQRASECERLAKYKGPVLDDLERAREAGEIPTTRQALEVVRCHSDAERRVKLFRREQARSRHNDFKKQTLHTMQEVQQEAIDIDSIRLQIESKAANLVNPVIALFCDLGNYRNILTESDIKRVKDGLAVAFAEIKNTYKLLDGEETPTAFGAPWIDKHNPTR